MADLAKLVVRMEADNKKLIGELEKSNRKLDKFERNVTTSTRKIDKQFSSLGGGLKKVIAGLGALAAVNIAKNMVRDAVELGDSIAKMANVTGFAAEALQQVQFAADRSGVPVATLNTSLQVFAKRVGEAETGVSPLITGLKKLDQQLLDNIMNARNQEDAFRAVIKAMDAEQSAVGRARIANAAFGRSGLAMANLVKDGAAGLDALIERFRELGGGLSDRAVANSEKMKDAMTDLGVAFSNRLANTILENSEAITGFVNSLIDAIPAVVKATAVFLDFFGVIDAGPRLRLEEIEHRIQNITSQIDRLKAAGAKVEDIRFYSRMTEGGRQDVSLKNALDMLEIFQKERATLLKQIAQEDAALETASAARRLQTTQTTHTQILETVKSAGAQWVTTSEGIQDQLINTELRGATRRLAAVRAFEKKRQDEITKMQAEGEALHLSLQTPEETAGAQLGRATELFNQGFIDLEDLSRAQDRFLQQTQNTTNLWGEMWRNTTDQFASGIGNAVSTAIFEQQSLADTMRSALRGVAQQVLSTLVEIGVKQLLLAATAKATLAANTTALVGSMAVIAKASAPAAAGMSLATAGGNAIPASAGIASTHALSQTLSGVAHDGGMIPTDGTYFLQGGEYVQSKENVDKGMNGALAVNFNIRTNDAAGFDTLLHRKRGIIVRMIQDAYEGRGKRGGPLR